MHRRGFAARGAAAATATPAGSATADRRCSRWQRQPGRLPEGFSVARTGQGAPAAWSVVEDTSVPGGRVLAQTSSGSDRLSLSAGDLRRCRGQGCRGQVRFKAVAGRVDRAGGIAVRLSDADNYYVVRANALEDNVNFYRVVQGSRREIHGAIAKVASDRWHTLSLKAEGDQFTIGFNGETLFTRRPTGHSRNAGKVALWTKADSVRGSTI